MNDNEDITSAKPVRRGISIEEISRMKVGLRIAVGNIEVELNYLERCIDSLNKMEMDYYDERDDDEL